MMIGTLFDPQRLRPKLSLLQANITAYIARLISRWAGVDSWSLYAAEHTVRYQKALRRPCLPKREWKTLLQPQLQPSTSAFDSP